MKQLRIYLLMFCILVAQRAEAYVYNYNIDGHTATAFIFKPEGKGPFPVIIYNHGMIVDKIGYDKAIRSGYKFNKICKALADSGFFVFAPIRESGVGNIPSHKIEVLNAIDYVKTLSDVDPSRITLMGFSRGALLALMGGIERKELKAIVLLAPAPGNGYFDEAVSSIKTIRCPILLLAEEGDDPIILTNFAALKESLTKNNIDHKSILYTRGGGHKLFWDIGYYWSDLIAFLKKQN